MPERPKPDLDRTREALRQHDARVDSEEPEEPGTEDEEPQEGEERKSDNS